jgi:hypothetical protein
MVHTHVHICMGMYICIRLRESMTRHIYNQLTLLTIAYTVNAYYYLIYLALLFQNSPGIFMWTHIAVLVHTHTHTNMYTCILCLICPPHLLSSLRHICTCMHIYDIHKYLIKTPHTHTHTKCRYDIHEHTHLLTTHTHTPTHHARTHARTHTHTHTHPKGVGCEGASVADSLFEDPASVPDVSLCLKASYTSKLRPHTLETALRPHTLVTALGPHTPVT